MAERPLKIIVYTDNFLFRAYNPLMSALIKNLRENNFLFGVLFVGFAIAPIVLKMISGSLGPTFSFYFFIVWIPLVSFSFALVKGWQETAVTSVLFLCAILLSLISYPFDPPMDFRRQIVHQAEVAIVFAALASLCLQLTLHRRWRR